MAKDYQFWINNSKETESAETKDQTSKLIKMREATKLLQASPPTVRKYARLGHYKEYRFGQKLVFYNKDEIINFILSSGE